MSDQLKNVSQTPIKAERFLSLQWDSDADAGGQHPDWRQAPRQDPQVNAKG